MAAVGSPRHVAPAACFRNGIGASGDWLAGELFISALSAPFSTPPETREHVYRPSQAVKAALSD